ncbi:hypothetical protein NP233_g6437 [Leucocoprinus birnbaumii]|uniref:Uncharacterized protein n=1 Tax=Leucocoprinus birnbaumii TaxID=56174 RepID=A0AAD5VR19_9AGAR|nr:hypothetical protein NP233_g6437 [Leucocoprinus birnbaumii]
MSVTLYLSGILSRIAATPPSAVPGLIAHGYTKYLWNYEPNSWVAKVASFYRVLTLLVALPVIILGVLDIVSYGIARTLGIVDDVKASTSDQATARPSPGDIPVIHINGESTPSDSANSDREAGEEFGQAQRTAASNLLSATQPQAFYASDSDGLGLAGADVFSPAASGPPSPTLSRKLPLLEVGDFERVDAKLQEGLRQRLGQAAEEDHSE